MIFKLLFIFLFVRLAALAEYRVFQLKVYKETPQGQVAVPASVSEEGVKIFLSNLDPEQYVGYFPLEKDEKIKYIATWMCRGRTNGKDFCENPRLKPVSTPSDSLNNK